MARRGSIPLTLEPPPPAPATGPCRVDKVFDIGGFCPARASRTVVAGMDLPVPVCLWHSLVACQQAGAHLVRVRQFRTVRVISVR